MKRSDANKLWKLVEQWTRAEIIARFGRFDNLEFAEYFRTKIDKEDEIRELVFGTSDLVQLGTRWGILPEKKMDRR